MRLLAEVISSFDFFRDKKIKSLAKTRLYFKIGCPICSQFEPIDITPFLEKREEIISMKEQVSLVRKLIAA